MRNILLHTLLRCFCALLFSSCCEHSLSYRQSEAHHNVFQTITCTNQEDDYFLVILVDAYHLDYSGTEPFFRSVARHFFRGTQTQRNAGLGHAWIYLQGQCAGEKFVLEGGHSGERDDSPPSYFDGIMNYHEWGYAEPTVAQKKTPRYEPNPLKYLWMTRKDGFFQKGSGGHVPTYAAKIHLTREQFETILTFIRPRHYPYCHYALMNAQCCTFVTQVAALAGVILDSDMHLRISPSVYFGNMHIRLWEDECYSTFSIATPDGVEKSLMHAVEKGEAEYALEWLLRTISFSPEDISCCETL